MRALVNGVLNLLKPPGMTSHDVVDQVRRVLGQRRVGHTGTLDPAATGVLVVLAGRATKLTPFLEEVDKTYRAVATFGVTTDSQDSTGEVLERRPTELGQERLEPVLAAFRGQVEQLPPMTSAVRVAGKRLHEMAREGKEVQRPARTVTVHRLECLRWEAEVAPGFPRALLECQCSKGTYVRTLVADLGEKLGCGAHVSFLLRLAVGNFTVGRAFTLEELSESAEPGDLLLSPAMALGHLPRVVLEPEQVSRVRSGNTIRLGRSVTTGEAESSGSWVRLLDRQGELVAIGSVEAGQGESSVRPKRVF